MNFAQMLLTPCTPLGEHQASRQQEPSKKVTNLNPDTSHASQYRHRQALMKFAAVMKFGWMQTKVIEDRLGYAQGAIGKTLLHWQALGLVERRPRLADPHEKWSRKKGYEWRFTEKGRKAV